jgi:hypothetical protein
VDYCELTVTSFDVVRATLMLAQCAKFGVSAERELSSAIEESVAKQIRGATKWSLVPYEALDIGCGRLRLRS